MFDVSYHTNAEEFYQIKVRLPLQGCVFYVNGRHDNGENSKEYAAGLGVKRETM